MSDKPNQTVSVMPDILSQEVSGETVLLDLNNEKYFGLNEVGTRIWQLLQTGANLDTIYRKLLDEYEVEADQLRQDFDKVINDLIKSEVISIEQD